jgi:hypothetical protein
LVESCLNIVGAGHPELAQTQLSAVQDGGTVLLYCGFKFAFHTMSNCAGSGDMERFFVFTAGVPPNRLGSYKQQLEKDSKKGMAMLGELRACLIRSPSWFQLSHALSYITTKP